ncbi:MAG: hypothetical protein Ct9H300mP9_7790 [Candidatus Neomarinimicrobiota bacterium]|nr:MAG: hypothetical protein Ct9H300mP9_7790 [Candidatus Neomarinimicrobiota bacterium]
MHSVRIFLVCHPKGARWSGSKINHYPSKDSEGRFADAQRLAKKGIRIFPTHHGFVQLIGETHLALGNVEDAKASFQRAIKLNAKDKAHIFLLRKYILI